ncbi:cyclic nucleotide-binding domain-containing protein [Fundidesulfovibrio terrae]|uniref:cyclic nucleotide-binding domain-containing protein n=1 Tax=Fundidesulfovibrio terrae TaxID=2922866 RepID=UPI001FAE9F9F|nr:cyclic nucleotide-binding domain-containing protein [Fundidesulfovibrio terrae]
MKTPEVGDKSKIFHKGQVIYKEGQSSNEAYIIKQGAVGLYRLTGNKRVNLGILRPGQIFGEMGVITEEKRTASAEALDYTEVIVLDQTLLHTLLLKSPRPIQIITTYLVERVRALNSRVSDRPSANIFASACNVMLLAWKAAAKAAPKNEAAQISTVELSKTIKDILLISQVEIDEIFDKLEKVHIITILDIKGTYFRKDPLLGTMKKSSEFVKERLLSIPDVDRFASVVKNMAKDNQDHCGTEMEFLDLDDFAREVQAQPETLLKKIAYGEFPENVFFFHKASALAFAAKKGPEFFQRAKRPRLKVEDLETVDDIVSVDNATLDEALSKLGFYKVSVLAAMAGEDARKKIFHNLSKKIATVVKEEMERMGEPDPGEASDVEDELISCIRTMKGLNG